MRSFFKRSSNWAPVLFLQSIACLAGMAAALPVGTPPTKIDVQEYDLDAAFARLYLSGAPKDILLNPLVVEVQVPPPTDTLSQWLLVNGQTLELAWDWISPSVAKRSIDGSNSLPDFPVAVGYSASTDYQITIPDYWGHPYDVQVSIGVNALQNSASAVSVDDIYEAWTFKIKSLNHTQTDFGFSMLVHPRSHHRLQSIIPNTHAGRHSQVEEHILPRSFAVEPRWDRAPKSEPVPFKRVSTFGADEVTRPETSAYDSVSRDKSFDIEAEIVSLLVLELEAGELQTQIAAKKQLIGSHLQRHRDSVPLRHLLGQCNGVLCAAKVIAQRICDKVGIATEPSFEYVKVQASGTQSLLALNNSGPWIGSSKSAFQTAQAEHVGAEDDSDALLQTHIGFSSPTDGLIKVLEIIATMLGLVALGRFLRRKLMPMRRRVERDADREERRNARAYRRAARRAELRSRWNTFTRSISCFRPQEQPRNENYEEKRALILQDAFLEQELEHAEKGEVMEAEIRELRNAHELVSSMIRSGDLPRGLPPGLAAPVADPPPPLVPLPYTPLARSRASSQTLPSYTSEILPDYVSRIDAAGSSGSIRSSRRSSRSSSMHASSYLSDDNSEPLLNEHDTAPSEVGSGRSRLTALSSVLDIERSPRISEETLRTRQSKDTRYSREF